MILSLAVSPFERDLEIWAYSNAGTVSLKGVQDRDHMRSCAALSTDSLKII